MRNNEANIFMFIASIIIGILIAMNMSFSRESKTIFLSSKQYQDAYAYRNNLLNDISNLIDKCNKYENKLEKYENNTKDTNKITQEVEKELNQNKEILGLTDLKGPGIRMTLKDANTDFVVDRYEYKLRLIHNTDIIHVINDLINAGAEAIAINGIRYVPTNGIYCNGAFLRINGIQVGAPFYIDIIGNKESLKSYMESEESYTKLLMLRKISVEIEEEDNIKIPAFNGEIKNKFINSVSK
ncbi:DUF881 domain-containing protein [Clostridium rectalis]|uniref:DUF881 domain-containing protein n=1 Tax=Clostridium rectalis TaxID=2040295 RepID=UPI000F63D655|nr:DUF881 domain-containing protein [Clostridium rectalis]